MPTSTIDPSAFPEAFCLEEIRCVPHKGGGYVCRATLYHDRASVTVSFNTERRDPKLRKGSFSSAAWPPTISSERGTIRIGDLLVRDCSASSFNPFFSLPHAWRTYRHKIECARDLWDTSSRQLRKLLFTTFWSGLCVKRSNASRHVCGQ